MANDVIDAVPGMPSARCHACGLSGYPCFDPKCPVPANIEAGRALAARPLPEGMVPFKPMTTPESRDALAKWMSLNAHDGSAYEGLMHLMVDRDLYETEVCRLSAELDRLRARLAEAEAEKKEVRKLLVRCHDRIHVLPRTSDTELASRIEAMLGRLK